MNSTNNLLLEPLGGDSCSASYVSGEFRKARRGSSRTSFYKPSDSSQRRGSRDIDDLTVDKLRYGAVGLYERETEQAVLNEAIDAMQNFSEGDQRSQHILISGNAGTGKTTLACSLKARVESCNGVFLYGKFDLYQRDEPYSGITAACRELCNELSRLEKDPSRKLTFEGLRHEVIQTLGGELSLLANVIPQLREVLRCPEEGPNRDSEEDLDTSRHLDVTKKRLNYAFRRFIRLLSIHLSPFVFVLDDLQWADANSIELLEALCNDTNQMNILLICCFRADEVCEHLTLCHLLDKLKEKKDQSGFRISEMRLNNLDETGSHLMLMDLLGTDEPSTLDLASICYRKTGGNPFFLISYLTLLYEEKLLQFNLGTFKWNWDANQIDTDTLVTDNVVELIQRKLSALPSRQRMTLVLAAFLGSTFDKHILFLLWTGFDYESQHPHDFDSLLEASVRDGIINVLEGARYRFVHDKIREGAHNLVDDYELPSIQARIGNILLSSIEEKESEHILFVALSLVNSGPAPSDPQRRTRLAELNLKAAQKAIELSGFETALTYIDKCCSILPADKWIAHYSLTLEVYSTAAELYAVLGKTEDMERQCNEVICQEGPVDGKLRIHLVRMDSLLQKARFDDAIREGLDVLKAFNIHFPRSSIRRSVSTIMGLVKSKSESRRLTTESSYNVTAMTDPRELCIMKILDKLCRCAYLGRSDILPLVALRILERTIASGITECSPPSYAIVALMMTGVVVDIDAGRRYAEYALRMVEKFDYRRTEAATIVICYGICLPWTRPLRSVLKPLIRGYERGLEVGDIDNAMWCVALYLTLSFHSGRPLDSLDTDARVYVNQMEELKREECIQVVKAAWQEWQNYMGQSDDPLVLTGDVMDEKRMLDYADELHHDGIRTVVCLGKQGLAVFFGEHERGAHMALTRPDDVASQFPGAIGVCIDPFYRSMSLYAMARKTKSHRYVKAARHYRSVLKGFIKKGNINLFHLEAMLDAEAAALKKDHTEARRYWETAIMLSRGFLHHTALANERYGEFLLHDLGDPFDASFRLEQAVQNYQEWGSLAKVDQLLAKYGHMKNLETTPADSIPSSIFASGKDSKASVAKDTGRRRSRFSL